MRALPFASALIVGASLAVAAEDRPLHLQDVPLKIEDGDVTRHDERAGEFEVEIETLTASGPETVAKVRVKNSSTITIEELEVHCTAFGAGDRELSTVTWKLSEAGIEPLTPQEAISVTLRFDTRASPVGSLTCNARGW